MAAGLQAAAGVKAERALPEEAARALTQGGGALDALSRKLQACTCMPSSLHLRGSEFGLHHVEFRLLLLLL